jgi:hypothetical protein
VFSLPVVLLARVAQPTAVLSDAVVLLPSLDFHGAEFA